MKRGVPGMMARAFMVLLMRMETIRKEDIDALNMSDLVKNISYILMQNSYFTHNAVSSCILVNDLYLKKICPL